MKRKIAVCGNGWSNEYLEIAMSGIRKCAEENNADVFLMFNFSSTDTEPFKQEGDANIYKLLEYGDFDGVILLANTFHLKAEFDYLRRIIKAKNLPAVSLEYQMPDIDFWGSDNYTGMYELCTHLVESHGVRDVVYISGPPDNAESDIRRMALEDVLGEFGITFKEENVLYGNWNYYEVERDLPEWIANRSKLPDAFVCANDVMAMATCAVLDRLGINVPNDVKVTGFDHLLSVRAHYPTIASVDRNWDGLSYQSMKYLLGRIDGSAEHESKYVDSTAVPAESCGCPMEKLDPSNKRLKGRSSYANYVENSFWSGHLCEMSDCFSLIVSEEELQDALNRFMVQQHNYEGDEVYFCLVDNFFSSLCGGEHLKQKGYTDQMRLVGGLKDGEPLELCTFPTKNLVPGYEEEAPGGRIYIFLPLYSVEGCYGYALFGKEMPMMYNYSAYNWSRSVVQNLNRVRQNIIVEQLNSQLEKLSVTDGLTGVYNRLGCENVAYPYLEQCHKQGKDAILMFADINKMKIINDKYGHLQGDLAICTVANVIKEVLQDKWIIVRYGGDEFLMVGECKDGEQPEDMLLAISNRLEETAQRMELPYRLKAGVGYVLISAEEHLNLYECLRKADEAMYAMKKRQHEEMQNK